MDTASITPVSLYSLLGSPRAPLVLDVRREPAYDEDPRLIAGAMRPEGDPAAFAARHAHGRPLVAYCVKGAEVGIGAAQALSQAGYEAAYLEGGLKAWHAQGLPTIRRKPEWRSRASTTCPRRASSTKRSPGRRWPTTSPARRSRTAVRAAASTR